MEVDSAEQGDGAQNPSDVDPYARFEDKMESETSNEEDEEDLVKDLQPIVQLSQRRKRLEEEALKRIEWLEATLDQSAPQIQERNLVVEETEPPEEEEFCGLNKAELRDLEKNFHFFNYDDSMSVSGDEHEEAGSEAGFSHLGAKQNLGRQLTDEDAQFDLKELPEALAVGVPITMTKSLKEEWEKGFSPGDSQQLTVNPFHPFESELEWELANWGIQDSSSNKAFDRLLAIPGISKTA